MAREVPMPRLSDTMEEGKVLQWYKQVGDSVKKGELLAEIETDKAVMDLESVEEGTLLQLLVAEGGSAALGAPIALVGEESELGQEIAVTAPSATESDEHEAGAATDGSPSTTPPATQPASKAETQGTAGRIKASPLARRIAAEQGLDLSSIRGTGPGGRIVKDDVEKAARDVVVAEDPAALPSSSEVTSLSRMQATIVRRMLESKTTVPHFYLTLEVDMSAAKAMRAEINAAWSEEEHISFNDLVIRATAMSLMRHPDANGSYQDGGFVYHKEANIGIAVAVPNGLLVPVLKNCDTKPLRQLTVEAKVLVERTREGKNRPGDLEGGTFTVSNLGMFGVRDFYAIVNPPQSAIIAVGGIEPRPVVRDGEIVVRDIMYLSISADHRILYGAPAAEFLRDLKDLLENPYNLLI
ncbi:MAG: dihydrolipoamide acetyltransferase family protein [Chloroflexota bacterium]|nr:dihydrolipoamide acetyltransferase family protein [Chloroflexota bacterium]MDE2929621.1 dihydrolipoamide acetyltransferase family protein [Chloroflexota bacterium]